MRVRTAGDLGSVVRIRALAGRKPGWRSVVVWPFLFTASAVQLAVGEVHLTDDRNGTFALHRRGARALLRRLLIIGAAQLVLLAIATSAELLGAAASLACRVALGVYVMSLLVGLIVVLASKTSATYRTIGAETPKGTRWTLSALPQRPGTRWSALESARARIDALPQGSVVVAIAANPPLQRLYISRGGLARGDKMRVFRVIE